MRKYLSLAALVLLAVAAAAHAKTYNAPLVDGHVTVAPTDWDADELAFSDPPNDNRWGASDGDLVDLYVTWDADSLYVGLTTVNGPSGYGNGYLLFVDTDAQNGLTGATDFTSADFYARKITFSTMGADVVMGGWSLPVHFDVKHCTNPAATTPVLGVHTQCNPGWKHVEAAFSWNGIYELGDGVVPAGTTLRLIAAVVGGDGSGAYDALPTSSTGVESNSGTPWDAYTNLDRYQEIVVDADGNGVPDQGYPPGGSISGTVTLDDPDDHETVVTLTAWSGGVAVRHAETPPGGGAYSVLLVPDDTYDVTATAFSYLDSTRTHIVVAGESNVTGIDFTLQRVNGAIEGSVALSGGPPGDVTVTAYNVATGAVGGDGPQVVPGGTGAFAIRTVLDGTYRVEAVAKGYVEQIVQAVVANESTADVGLLTLPVVVATKYSFVDDARNTILGAGTTVSLPPDSVYYYAKAWIEPRDDGDRVAYWDDGAQGGIHLTATKLDPAYPTSGTVVFAGADSLPLPGSLITSAMFEDGRAPFLVADDAVEVLRVLATKDSLEGVLEVGIDVPAPAKLALASDASTIAVGTGTAHIVGQLEDASGNAARVSGVVVSMLATGVGGQFSLSSPETDPNGRFELDFTGTVAGTARVTAVIPSTSPYAHIDVDTLSIVLEAGDLALVGLSSNPGTLRAGDSATVTARVLDAWGNGVALEGLSIALAAHPGALVASLESPIVTGADGVAEGTLVAGGLYGVIELSGTATGIAVQSIAIPIDAGLVAIDEQAPESDPAHNSDAGVDLTIMRAANGADTLAVTLDFASSWDGVHLAAVLETHGDAAGGTSDPFGFPINYGHPLLPDYCFTYKYADGSYGDLRRSLGGPWEHYDFVNHEWRIGYADGVNAVAQGYITKTADHVVFKLPLAVIEVAVGDTVRLEAYVMQETNGEKRTALDSTPADATHDMLPDTGNWWDTATTPVTLTSYGSYVVRQVGAAPLLSEAAAAPGTAAPGNLVTYTVRVADGGGGIGDVFIDLSDLGGSRLTRMLDDGAGPDGAAGDGIYTAADTLGTSASNGEHVLTVTAKDTDNIWAATIGIELTVVNPPVVLRRFDDDIGDDHGPDHTDADGNPIQGLYYRYPTNLVFLPGSFDLTSVEIFSDGDWIVFRTYVDDLVNHEDPGAADWGAPNPSESTCPDPYRTDLNLQKLDIYIDAREGEGATSGFPNRYVDIAPVDKWDYGISVEGWGKWFVVSNSSNSQASWTLYKNDGDIQMCDNYAEDWIDVRVDKSLFGQDLGPDLVNIRNWDVIVTLSSHDQDSNDQNLGGIRWVIANTDQWQFGGGRDSESGRDRDANVIDVAVSHGEGKQPGRPQSEMLDYTTPEAAARFAANRTACVLEASFAVDTSPPLVEPFPADPDVPHIPWVALADAPAVLWTTITDETGVDVARLFWYPVGQEALRDSVEMVNLVGDVWAGDLSHADIAASTNVIDLLKTGPARDIVVSIYAKDSSPGENAIVTTPREIGVPEPWAESQTVSAVDDLVADGAAHTIVFQDGTVLLLDETDLPASEADLDLALTPLDEASIDLSNIRGDMDFVGVARDIRLLASGGGTVSLVGRPRLTLHYPQYDVGSLDERKFGVFWWVDDTARWIFRGGGGEAARNAVTTEVENLGLFGVFFWEGLGFEGEGLSGVLAEPNPFSPNGDGLYDETMVSFYLGRDADHVNIEFYDLTGRLARRLVYQQPTDYTGRTPVVIPWDGTDETGRVVPYGIYVMRVEAKFKTQPTYERVNKPVVVIK